MTLTLREAAGLTGKSKSTLTRAIKAGRLSASRSTGGRYAIDPAELARAFPFNPEQSKDDGARHDAPHGAPRNSDATSDDAAILRLKLSLLTEERDRERNAAERERGQLAATIADLRERLDRAEQRVTALIGDHRPKKRRPWWLWARR